MPGSIGNLPTELLDHIFTFLDIKERIQTERVCRRWRIIGTGPWSEPKTFIYNDWRSAEGSSLIGKWHLTDDILCAVLSRFGAILKKVRISKFDRKVSITSHVIERISNHCPNLIEIEVETDALSQNSLEILGEKCRKLKVVSLIYREGEELSFQSFFKNCEMLESLTIISEKLCPKHSDFGAINKNLKVLRVASYSLLQLEALEKLVERCNHIQELFLGHLDNYQMLSSGDLLKVMLHYSDTLKVLGLTGSMFVINWCSFLTKFHNLEKLFMFSSLLPFECSCSADCHGITSRQLKVFNVFAYRNIFSDAFGENLLKRNDHLQELHLAYVSHEPLDASIFILCGKYTDSMTVLKLEFIEMSFETGGWCQLLAALPNLQSLALNSCRYDVDNAITRTLSQNCLKLKNLEVSNTLISDDGIIDLCSLPCLVELDVSDLYGVTDTGIKALALQGRLEKLDISQIQHASPASRITDASCCLLARHCPKFRKLSANGLPNITNNLVSAFYDSIHTRFLKNMVCLEVEDTSVTSKCKKHSRLYVEM